LVPDQRLVPAGPRSSLKVWRPVRDPFVPRPAISRESRPRHPVLVLEDVHWADADSLALIDYLADVHDERLHDRTRDEERAEDQSHDGRHLAHHS
jgi:hypothetical protein